MFLSCYIIFKNCLHRLSSNCLKKYFVVVKQYVQTDSPPTHTDERTGAAENILLSGHPP